MRTKRTAPYENPHLVHRTSIQAFGLTKKNCAHVLTPAKAAVESTAQDALQRPDEVVPRDRPPGSLRATRHQILVELVPRGALPLGGGRAFGVLEGVQLLRS